MNLFFIEIEFSQAGKTAEPEIMFKFRLRGNKFRKGMEVQKFPERERQHSDFNIASGQISRQVRREQIGV